VFGLGAATRIYVALGATDMRKGFDGLVATCRRLKIPVRDYLGSILPGLADFPINRIAELTPSAWATS
jgi:hypothetical protein